MALAMAAISITVNLTVQTNTVTMRPISNIVSCTAAPIT